VALVLAATVHDDEFWIARRSQGSPERPKAINPAFESMVAGMAETILLRRQGPPAKPLTPSLELAARILEACDGLDEAIEFAALDRMSIPDAIAEFFADVGPQFDQRLVDALRQITCARPFPALSDALPVLPAAAVELLRSSDHASATDLESIVAADPVLTTKLVGLANSALFGSSSEVTDLNHAIMRLGVPFARKVLLADCFGHVFASSELSALWKHSKMVAVHAHELAAECGYDQDIAYVAGIVHDVGSLVIQSFPAAARLEEAGLRSAGFPQVYAEFLVYGTDHAALGSMLLKKWDLPSGIVEAVALQHSTETADSVLAGILNIAEDDALADGAPSEALWRGLRRAIAGEMTGIYGFSQHTEHESAIWLLAS
jgi:putative nucleotidyltransferase with HDIG domain